jgi:hypothetical protein
VKKVLLKLMMILICIQTTWVQASTMKDKLAGHSPHITASEHSAHEHVTAVSHLHDHDCEKCVQHCHQASALLMQVAPTLISPYRSALSTYNKRALATAPPSKIERPKWDATAV